MSRDEDTDTDFEGREGVLKHLKILIRSNSVLGSLQWHKGMMYLIWSNGTISLITSNAKMVEVIKVPFNIKTVISYYA